HRFRQPWTDINFALGLGAFQPIEAKPRNDAHEVGFVVFDSLLRLRARPAQKSVLHCVLGVGAAAEHAIGKARQAPTVGLEGGGLAHAANSRAAGGATSIALSPTFTRRHSLAKPKPAFTIGNMRPSCSANVRSITPLSPQAVRTASRSSSSLAL